MSERGVLFGEGIFHGGNVCETSRRNSRAGSTSRITGLHE